MRKLKRRGLAGVKLVISDAHEGIKAAVSRVFRATWQRCRVHFMRNVLAHAGKSGRRVVAAFIATAFAQDDADAAKAQWRLVADQIRVKLPKLAALLDAYSRKCVGWNLSKRIDTQLALGALEQALATRDVRPGLIHHSDRGVQYASTAYVKRLQSVQAHISMSAIGNPYDNAKAESFFKTLKQEEVYLKQYQTFEEAETNIGQFIEDVYNTKRLHSSLGYLPPVEFEMAYAQEMRY